ncbi:MAG: hypothetical protein QOI51_1954, partial [Nocardioidaceae bacterium]|nr:hypothetical protein [Nocardioidaceae bacterium]
TLGGVQFAWASWTTVAMVGGAGLGAVVLVWHESRVAEPIIPLALFRNRTIVLAIVASIGVGVAIFGASIYLSQYMQLSRGETPTVSGLLTIPLIGGLLVASTVVGQVISRTGVWKRYLVTGGVLLTGGLLLMSRIRVDTGWVYLAVSMAILGAGIGLLMQNLVLVVQNVLPVSMLGSGSSSVSFFRTLGGAVGVSALGALLAHRVTAMVTSGLAGLGIRPTGGNTIPDVQTLPGPVRSVVESAYGQGIGEVFLAAVPLGVIALVAVIMLPNAKLGTKSGVQQLVENAGDSALLDVTPVQVEESAAAPAEVRR